MSTGVSQYTSLSSKNADLVRTIFSGKLRRKAIPKDIYKDIRADRVIYKRQELQIPGDVIMPVTPEAQTTGTVLRVGLKLPINANIIRGNGVAMGTEVPPLVRSGSLYRNNYRFVVQDKPGYGEHRLDGEYMRLYESHVSDLAPHAAAEEGLEIRMSLVETFGWNLQAGSTATTCTAHWNPNVYVAGIDLRNQPDFHPNLTTYTNRIVSAMDTASGGNGAFAQTPAQMLSGKIMDDLARRAFAKRMWPLMIGGQQAFILTISQLQAARFSNSNFTDTLGARWIQYAQLTNPKVQSWNGLLGVWKSAVGADIYVVRDDRLPTLLPSGSAEPYGLQALYMWPTDNDLRRLENETIRDASILHGAGAVALLEPEKMHMISQDWDYNVRNGVGYAGNRGYQLMRFDVPSTHPLFAGGTQHMYFGSMLVVLGRAENV